MIQRTSHRTGRFPRWPRLAGATLLLAAGCSSPAASPTQDAPAPSSSSAPSDPVAGSEDDTTLLGADDDGDGVRDDVDSYIATLEKDPQKRMVLVSFARESTAMMILGGTDGTSKAAGLAQAQRVARTIDCLHDLYAGDLEAKRTILESIRDALYDNASRLQAYNHASTLVSGALLRGGRGCDPAITGVSR